MGLIGSDDDHAAVLETVRRFFGDPEAPAEGLLAGRILEWARLVDAPDLTNPYDHGRKLVRAELVELGVRLATVDVLAEFWWNATRGTHELSCTSEGPVTLEKTADGWRIVDFELVGRRREASIVLGTLAEQHQPGASVRVLGLDRGARGTTFAVELRDSGARGIRIANAYALVEGQTMWSRLTLSPREPVPEGDARIYRAESAHPVDLEETVFAIALDVRSASGKLPFVLKVAHSPPVELVAQPAPRRLPPLRGSWPRNLLLYAGISALVAWFDGWLAILVPIYLGLNVYWQIRTRGLLVQRLDPVRYLVDAAVVAAVFGVLWESPLVDFAVPFLVATALFLGLGTLAPRRNELRVIAALTAGFAWLFLLGTSTGPLSPCRLADGRAATAADTFARALAAGRVAEAVRLEHRGQPALARGVLAALYSPVAHSSLTSVEQGAPAERYCSLLEASSCYRYGPPAPTTIKHVLVIRVGCDGTTWRIYSWI